MRIRTGLLASSLLVAACGSPALAQSGEHWVRTRLGGHVRADSSWADVRLAMMTTFRASDPNGDGVTPADYDTLRRIAQAQARIQTMQQTLRHDLNGDGDVGRDELALALAPSARQNPSSQGVQLDPTDEQMRSVLDRLVSNALKPDADGDGLIRFAELLRSAQAQAEQATAGWGTGQFVPMTLDADKDGVVARAEYEAVVRAEFDRIDDDRNGKVSTQEAQAFIAEHRLASEAVAKAEHARRLQAEREAKGKTCGTPPPPARARIVLIGAHEGRGLSTVAVGSDDHPVTVAGVDVEPGSEPVFLVLISREAMIWQIGGAVDRIGGVVAVSEKAGADGAPRVGVAGLPRDKVHIAAKAGCLPAFHADQEAGEAVAAVSALYGREPSGAAGAYGAGTIGAPSGDHEENRRFANAVALPDTGPASSLWEEVVRHNPGGLVRVDPQAVVARLPVKRFDVLPQKAGLAQLVDEGVLKVANWSTVLMLTGDKRVVLRVPSEFLIQKRTRLPPGLSGHEARFILARDVPMPDGVPQNACVRSEETGKPIAGRSC